MPAVVRRCVDVCGRTEIRLAYRAANSIRVGGRDFQQDGHGVNAAEGEADSAVDRRGRIDDAGAVAADRHGGESVALARWDGDLRQQLARPGGGHVDAEEELLGSD